ncbi:hypothetical protein Taro_046671 [Colocasia esculenta]|uniref:Uncharacterized protein n=1 Tax=Colocasia esculenta TaxID=4460 RepID=A0A843X6F1_COLES|nr:hypothetical protein [Colocasia esculenta]
MRQARTSRHQRRALVGRRDISLIAKGRPFATSGYASRSERDNPGGRVLVASVEHRHLHARQVSCAGWPTDVMSRKATASHVAFRSRRSARPGGSCCEVFWRFEVLEVHEACSRRKDVAWSGGKRLEFVFFTKATDLAVATKSLQADPSRQGGASALVTLTKRVAHEAGMFYVVNVLSGLRVRGYETERLFLCCVVRSRFDPFEVCPGVGTVVTVVVACAVPEWWHSFSYGCFCAGTLWFSACERDRGMRRVLNATALVVAFLLPSLSVDVCMRAKCRVLGGLLTSRNPGRTELPQALLDQGGAAARFFGDSRFWRCVRRVLAARTSREVGGNAWSLCSSRSGNPWSSSRIRVCACKGDRPCRRDKVATGRPVATGFPIATGGASALVTLTKRVAHEMGRELGLESLKVPGMDLQCVRLQSRFDPFEVCPSVGTVVTAVVACGVPEWWHSFSYGWYLYPVRVFALDLYRVRVIDRDKVATDLVIATSVETCFLLSSGDPLTRENSWADQGLLPRASVNPLSHESLPNSAQPRAHWAEESAFSHSVPSSSSFDEAAELERLLLEMSPNQARELLSTFMTVLAVQAH